MSEDLLAPAMDGYVDSFCGGCDERLAVVSGHECFVGCELCGEDLSLYNTVDARAAAAGTSLPSVVCFRCLASHPSYARNEAVLVSTPIALNIARLASHSLSVGLVYESVECVRGCGRRMVSHPSVGPSAPCCFVCSIASSADESFALVVVWYARLMYAVATAGCRHESSLMVRA